jgi:RNA polymerase sigma factor (sigma-70 family)
VISVHQHSTDEVRVDEPTAEVGMDEVLTDEHLTDEVEMAEVRMAELAPEEAVRGHLTVALRLARMLVSDPSTAEDVAAESVARLLAARRRVHVDNVDAYLRRIVVNQVVGRGRRSATERKFGHRLATSASASDSGDQVVGRLALAAALDQLAPRQRAVLVLRYYEDLSEMAVAELLHIPIGSVKSSASRGLEDLRRLLAEGNLDG